MLKIGRKWRPFNQFTFSKNHFIHSFSLLSVMVHCRKKIKENLSEHVWIQVGTRNGSTLHNVNYPLRHLPISTCEYSFSYAAFTPDTYLTEITVFVDEKSMFIYSVIAIRFLLYVFLERAPLSVLLFILISFRT